MFYLLAVLTSSTIVDYFDNDNDNHRFHAFSTKHSLFPRRCSFVQGVFFNWYPPRKYGKPRLGVPMLT